MLKMKKILLTILFTLALSGGASADEFSYTCQIENSYGELIPQTKTLYEIKNGRVYEDTYEIEGVKNLMINSSIVTFNFNSESKGYTDESYHKVNLSTGNFYKIDYKTDGGADTTFGKCQKF